MFHTYIFNLLTHMFSSLLYKPFPPPHPTPQKMTHHHHSPQTSTTTKTHILPIPHQNPPTTMGFVEDHDWVKPTTKKKKKKPKASKPRSAASKTYAHDGKLKNDPTATPSTTPNPATNFIQAQPATTPNPPTQNQKPPITLAPHTPQQPPKKKKK